MLSMSHTYANYSKPLRPAHRDFQSRYNQNTDFLFLGISNTKKLWKVWKPESENQDLYGFVMADFTIFPYFHFKKLSDYITRNWLEFSHTSDFFILP